MTNSILIYSLQTAIALTLFLIFYKLFLKKETWFRLNRVFLVSGLIFSALFPFISFNFTPESIQHTYTLVLDRVVVNPNNTSTAIQSTWSFSDILFILYFSGVIIIMLKALFRMFQIGLLIRKSNLERYKAFTLVKHSSFDTPFSVFNYIFITPDLHKEEGYQEVLAHEASHAQQGHSLDLVVFEIFKALQWFNPFVYVYGKSIRENHEFLADREVIKKFDNKLNYQNLMLNFVFKAQYNFINNNFSKSMVTKRIEMITKGSQNPKSLAKYILIIPLLVSVFYIVSCTNAEKKETEETEVTVVDEKPYFPGGQNALITFISNNMKYPEGALKEGIQGQVVVSFVVGKSGKVKDIKVVKGVNEELDNEAMRVIGLLPEWEPGKKNGKPVDIQMNLPISFKLN